jgi:glycosyltransferase involved in cell wall biosynthesis
MVQILLSLGIFGILGLSVLCPLLALSGYYFLHRKSEEKGFSGPNLTSVALRIDIIIPAHNESTHLGATLTSIKQSIHYLRTRPQNRPVPLIVIHVGADGCTDNTCQVVRRFPMVSLTRFEEKIGKWAVIKRMVEDSSSDWVMLVDAGTLWPERFLLDAFERICTRSKDIMAIAPSYRPQKAGWLHRMLWGMEITLKRLEAFCGGPVSLHGATVGYKTSFLKKALVSLGNTLWLNDDVVIPLTLRALYPKGVILYPVGEVRDAGVEQHQLDLGRRRRLLLGNLQWVRALLPSCLRRNPIAGLVAGRRLFRLLWAYWFGMIVFGLAMAFHFVVLPVIATLGVLMLASGSVRQISGAALISLLAPFLLVRANKYESGAWV